MKIIYYYVTFLTVCLSLPLLSELVAVPNLALKPPVPDNIHIAVIGASLSSLAHLYYLSSGLPPSARSRLAITIFEPSESFASCTTDIPIHAFSTDRLFHALLPELGLSSKNEAHDSRTQKHDNIGIWNANASVADGKDWIMRYSAQFRQSPIGLTSFLTQLVKQYGITPVLQLYRHMSTLHAQLVNVDMRNDVPFKSLDELVGKLNLTTPYLTMSMADLFADQPAFVEQFIEPLLREHGTAKNMNALTALILLIRKIYMKPGLSFSTLSSRVTLMAALLATLKRQVNRVDLLFNSPVEKVTSIWTMVSGVNMESKSRFQIHLKKNAHGHPFDEPETVLYEKLILATPIATLPPFYYQRVRSTPLHSNIGEEYDPEWKNYKSRFLYEQVHCVKVTSQAGLNPDFFMHAKKTARFGTENWSWPWPLSSLSQQPHEAAKDEPDVPSTIFTNQNEHGLLTIFNRDSSTFEISSTSRLSKDWMATLFRELDFKIVKQASFLTPCCHRFSPLHETTATQRAIGRGGPGEEPVPTDQFPSLNPARDAYLLSALDALCPTQDHIELLLMQAKNMAQLIQQRLLQEQA